MMTPLPCGAEKRPQARLSVRIVQFPRTGLGSVRRCTSPACAFLVKLTLPPSFRSSVWHARATDSTQLHGGRGIVARLSANDSSAGRVVSIGVASVSEVREHVRAMRNEAEVFADLAVLCRSGGYVHALANLSFRDNIVRYSEQMRPEDMLPLFSPDRLIRTEISTLIGLVIQGEMDWTMPSPHVVQEQMDRTDSLLKELHDTFLPSMSGAIAEQAKAPLKDLEPLGRGEFLREVIFYGGESAYSFQYRDFAPQKYAADDAWLKANRGFSIFDARAIAQSVARLQEQKLMATVANMATIPPEQWSVLPGYSFSVREVAAASGLAEPTVEAVLNAFALAPGEKNEAFRALDDFNVVNATPLLRLNGEFVLFQSYSLVEALYESPFYWMAVDKPYASTAMQNRGRFTEFFCRDRLELVFGKARVHANVDIFESKSKKVGEIDVLVLFGDRAVIIQAKSKRLTLESRKGKDGRIRDDFKKSVQDSYGQGLTCAQKITNPKVKLVGPDGREIRIRHQLSEIYILCVVADHYPALHFQARQFLKYIQSEGIRPPMVLDVFTLDAITEMLTSPLRFLSYINRRVGYTEQLMATHETVILAYHLKKNLWLENDVDMLMLGDDISVDLDIAMGARRDGVNGQRTPDGILTRLSSTTVGHIITAIEARPHPGVIDFGFLLLSMSEKAAVEASAGIDRIAELARRDGKTHDISLGFEAPQSGFTVHCSADPVPLAEARLRRHCELRKYSQNAKTWFGVCLHPSDQSLRFGFKLDYEWQPNGRLDRVTRDAPRPVSFREAIEAGKRRPKVGRNESCPCGSGRKYKRCHGQ